MAAEAATTNDERDAHAPHQKPWGTVLPVVDGLQCHCPNLEHLGTVCCVGSPKHCITRNMPCWLMLCVPAHHDWSCHHSSSLSVRLGDGGVGCCFTTRSLDHCQCPEQQATTCTTQKGSEECKCTCLQLVCCAAAAAAEFVQNQSRRETRRAPWEEMGACPPQSQMQRNATHCNAHTLHSMDVEWPWS